jgi:hypothetical protein
MSLNMLRVLITVLILCTFGVEILDGVRNATDMAFYRNLIGKKIPLTMHVFGLVFSFLRLIKMVLVAPWDVFIYLIEAIDMENEIDVLVAVFLLAVLLFWLSVLCISCLYFFTGFAQWCSADPYRLRDVVGVVRGGIGHLQQEVEQCSICFNDSHEPFEVEGFRFGGNILKLWKCDVCTLKTCMRCHVQHYNSEMADAHRCPQCGTTIPFHHFRGAEHVYMRHLEAFNDVLPPYEPEEDQGYFVGGPNIVRPPMTWSKKFEGFLGVWNAVLVLFWDLFDTIRWAVNSLCEHRLCELVYREAEWYVKYTTSDLFVEDCEDNIRGHVVRQMVRDDFDDRLVDNNGGRRLIIVMQNFKFNYYVFREWLLRGPLMNTATSEFYLAKCDAYARTGCNVNGGFTTRLPSTALPEISRWWIGKGLTHVNYLLSINAVKAWTRPLSYLSAQELMESELMLPILAMYYYDQPGRDSLRAQMEEYSIYAYILALLWFFVGFFSTQMKEAHVVMSIVIVGGAIIINSRLFFNVIREELFKCIVALVFSMFPFSYFFGALFLAILEVILGANLLSVIKHISLCMFPLPIQLALHMINNQFFSPMNVSYYLTNSRVVAGDVRDGASVTMPPPLSIKKDPKLVHKQQHLFGLGVKGYRPVAYANNLHNQEAAVRARITNPTPEPDGNVLERFRLFVRRNITKIFGDKVKIESLSFETYLLRSNATPRVKQQLREQHEILVQQGIDECSNLNKNELHEFTKREAFVKVENNVYRTPMGSKNKAPRLIQGGSKAFICIVGPWMAAFQGYIKSKWNHKNHICFTSGVTSKRVLNVVNKPGRKFLEDDVGSWDSSVCGELLETELEIFRFFGAPQAVLQLIEENIKTHGSTLGGIRYKRKGMRKSGDPYTSVGNSILNGLIHVFIFCEVNVCTYAQSREMISMAVQGDDNLLSHVGPEIDFKQWMLLFGFDSVALYRDNITDAEFCSCVVYHTKQGLVLGPKIGKVMAKVGFFVNPPCHVSQASLVRGTALGMLTSCNHIPPLRAYMHRLLELTDGVIPWFSQAEEWKMKHETYEEVEETWLLLDQRYRWSTDLQKLFEEDLRNAKLGDLMASSCAQYLCEIDTAGPKGSW